MSDKPPKCENCGTPCPSKLYILSVDFLLCPHCYNVHRRREETINLLRRVDENIKKYELSILHAADCECSEGQEKLENKKDAVD